MSKARGKGRPARRTKGAPAHRSRQNGARPWPTPLILASYLFPIAALFGAFLFSDTMIYGSDMIPMGYMARKLYKVMWSSFHEFPLWNPYILGGLPFVDALHGDIFYPTTALKFLFPLHRGIGLVLVLHVFLAGAFMYACLRREGLSRPAAWFGGLAYMSGPYLISLFLAGHDAKIYVTSLFPLAYLLLRRAERSARASAYLGFGLVVGLLILTSHIQMAYFALWVLGLQFVTHAASLRKDPRAAGRAVGLFALSLAVGVAIGAVQLYPSYVYTSQYGPRAGGMDYEKSTSWSLHPEEVVSLWVPEFVSYRSAVSQFDGYWGRNPFKLNCESPGAIPFLLALAFLLFAKGARRRFFAFITVGALIYALGATTPLFRIFYEVIPGVKLFRAPSIIAFVIHFAVCFLAAHGLERWVVRREQGPAEARRVLLLLGGLGLVLVALLLGGSTLADVWRVIYPGLAGAKRQALLGNLDNLRFGSFLGLAALGLLAWLLHATRGKKVGAAVAILLLGGATLFMNWRVGRDFIMVAPLEKWVRSDPIIEFLSRPSKEPFRVLSISDRYPANYLPIFEIESAQGFHDNRVRTYDELVYQDERAFGRRGLIDLLNVRYVISERPIGGFREVMRDGPTMVLENDAALSRASLVRNARVEDDAATLAAMRESGWDPRSVVFLAEQPAIALDPAGDASGDRVEWVRYSPNEIDLRVTTRSAAMLVISNNYLPYWSASVNDSPAPLLRADYSFQALAVAAGESRVSVRFRSAPFERARRVSVIGFVIAAAGVLAGAFRRRPILSRPAEAA